MEKEGRADISTWIPFCEKMAPTGGPMHRKLLIPLTLSLIAGCGDPPPATPTTRSLILLNTTDEHSHLLGATAESEEFPVPTAAGDGKVLGGIGRRAAILEQERAAAA